MASDEKKAPTDNVGDLYDDGLWPDFDQSTESVRTAEAVATGYSRHGAVSGKSKSSDSTVNPPAKKAASSGSSE